MTDNLMVIIAVSDLEVSRIGRHSDTVNISLACRTDSIIRFGIGNNSIIVHQSVGLITAACTNNSAAVVVEYNVQIIQCITAILTQLFGAVVDDIDILVGAVVYGRITGLCSFSSSISVNTG